MEKKGVGGFRARLAECLRESFAEHRGNLGGQACAGLYPMTMAVAERELLHFALKNGGGNKTRAAKLLGISRTTLNRKLRQHDLGDED